MPNPMIGRCSQCGTRAGVVAIETDNEVRMPRYPFAAVVSVMVICDEGHRTDITDRALAQEWACTAAGWERGPNGEFTPAGVDNG